MIEIRWLSVGFHSVALPIFLKFNFFFTYKQRLKKSWSKQLLRFLSQSSHPGSAIICSPPAGNYLQWGFQLSCPSNCYPSVSIKPLSHLSHLNISFLFLNTSNQILTSNIYIAFPQTSASEDSVICLFF